MIKKVVDWYYRNASIRKKLIISFCTLVSIPILVLGLYTFSQSKKNLQHQTIDTMENNLTRLIVELNGRFQRETDSTKYLAYNRNFRRTLENSPYDNVKLAGTLNDTVEPIFWYFITSDIYMKAINIYTPYIRQKVGSFLKSDVEVKDKAWYKRHEKNYNTIWTYEDGKVYASRSILDTATTSRTIGVLRTEFFLSSLLEPAESMNYLDNGLVILDDSSTIVYEKLTSSKEVNGEVLQEILRTKELKRNETGRYILKAGRIDICNWKVYYFIDKAKISEQLSSIVLSTLLVVGICLIIVIMMISIISKVLSKRILNLRGIAQDVAKGEFEKPIFCEDTDEIGIVMNSIGNMTLQLNEMINRVYKMEIEKKATELKALQAMINPHFLYNSLSTIKWKAITQGNEEISEITGLLAKFYRTSLNNGQQLTTVRNELENIKSYIEIQRSAHDKCFDAVYTISEEGMDYLMLNFLLQPIVENAIKHGIDHREDMLTRGIVIIEFSVEGDFLVFRVYNNGPELEVDKLNDLLHQPGKGYGIYNIQQRIELYYGKECGLYASINPEGYTCVTVKIKSSV